MDNTLAASPVAGQKEPTTAPDYAAIKQRQQAVWASGDFATIGLVCAGCFGGGMVMLTIKPHVAARFASWGHIWEDVYDKGFQQTHTLTAAASGGLIGVGAGKGWLSGLPAADTDIVFGFYLERADVAMPLAGITVDLQEDIALQALRATQAKVTTKNLQ